MNRVFAFVLLLLFAGACQQTQAPASSTSLPQENLEEAVVPELGKPMMPAYKLPGDFRPLKADEYSDYRDAHPELYAITNAPTVGVRPVAEYEDAARLMITVSSNTLPAGIKKNLVDVVKYGKDVSDVYVIYDSSSVKSNFTSQLQSAGVSPSAVNWVNLENGSIWVRDYGPVPIVSSNGKLGMVDLRYYHQRIYDDAIPTKLGNLWNLTTYRAPVDFEGGNFMSDTDGNCFASEGLLWYNGVGEAQLEEYFQDYLGCSKLYVVKALQNEGTTHLDMQMKLTSDSTVIVGEYGYSQDQANYKITNDNAAMFENLGYNVVRMPMPSNSDGNFRTYINSLFVSGINMVPT
jgi:agmatine/peptidylarginine deiminase